MKAILRFASLLAVVLVMGIGCTGPSYKLQLKPYELKGVDYPFPSGLRVFIQPDHSQPVVLVTGFVGTGSSAEPEGLEGMAHLVEHLCFRAKHGNNPPVMEQIMEMGGAFNGTTFLDRTNYFTTAPKDSLEALLRIEANRMLNPLEGVTEKTLQVEREVVRNELRLNKETAGGPIFDPILAHLFPKDHPYSRSTIGTHGSLDNIKLSDTQEFVKKHYVPSNFTITIVGDVTPDEAKQAILKTIPKKLIMGDAKELKLMTPKPRITMADRPEPPMPASQELIEVDGPVVNDQIALAWSLPGFFREDSALLQVTGIAMTYALAKNLDPDFDLKHRGEIKGINCGLWVPGVEATIIGCDIELVEGQEPEKIIKRTLDGLVEMWRTENEPFQRQLFAVARAQLLADQFRESASIGRGVALAQNIHWTGQPDMFSQQMRSFAQMNHYDMRNLAYKYLTRERVVTGVIHPYDETEDLGTVARDEGSTWAGATLEASQKDYLPLFAKMNPNEIKAMALMPDTSQIKDFTLDNGLRVIIKQHGDAPFAQIQLMARGGLATTKPSRMLNFSSVDYNSRDPLQIAGVFSNWTTMNYSVVAVEGPSGNLPALMDLLNDRITTARSTYTSQKLKRALSNYERQIKTAEKRPETWATRARWKLLLGDHPLSEAIRFEGDTEELAKLGSADFKELLKKQWAPKNTVLMVVGDIDVAATEKLVRDTWSAWRAEDPGTPMPEIAPAGDPPKRQIAFVDRPTATQSIVTIGCHLQQVENPVALEVLQTYLQTEMFEAIRQQTGASYGVYPSMQSWPGGLSIMNAGGAITNKQALDSLKTMLAQIEDIGAGKIKKGELNRAKFAVAREMTRSNVSNDAMLSTIRDAVLWNRKVSEIENLPDYLAKVSDQDFENILAPCVNHEVVTIIAPKRLMYKPLAQFKIPIEEVDWRAGSDATPGVKTDLEKEKSGTN